MRALARRVLRWVRGTSLHQSIFRTPPDDSSRGRALKGFGNVFLHIYPVRVPRALLRFGSTWRMGFISAVLFGILFVTGVYLMFFYTPAITMAYGDMQRIRTEVGFGQLIRNVHRWGAHLMVIAVVLHLVRVFLSGSYKAPRQFNWVIGVLLLVVTLAYSFTGYLLPWDQLAYWAVTVGSDLVAYVPVVGPDARAFLLGGNMIGQATLLRFYVIHVAVLTIAFFLLMAVHIWRVRKDGHSAGEEAGGVAEGEAGVDAGETAGGMEGDGDPAAARGASGSARAAPESLREGERVLGAVEVEGGTGRPRDPLGEVFTWPHLIVRHQVVALAVTALVLALGIAFEAPLRELANPDMTPDPSKAPWYFVGIQELLAHFDPLVAGVLVPSVLVGALLVLPWVDRNPSRRPEDRRVAKAVFWLVLGAFVVLTVVGALFRGPGWGFVLPWVELHLEV